MMTSQAFTIAGRVMRQLIRDRRTMALILIVPLVVMTLIGLSFPAGWCPGLYCPGTTGNTGPILRFPAYRD